MNLNVSRGNSGEQWDCCENPLNFSESGWWGRILSEMKVLIPILIGLLVVGCGKETSKPETKAKSPSTSPAQEANNNQPETDPTAKPLTGDEAFEILRDGLSGITFDKRNKATSFVAEPELWDGPSITFVSRVPPDFPSDKSVAGQDLRRIIFRVERYSETNRAKIVKIDKRLNEIRDASSEIRIAQSKLRYPRRIYIPRPPIVVPKPIPTRPEKDQNKTEYHHGMKLKRVPTRPDKDQNKTRRPSRYRPTPKKNDGGLKGIPSRQPSGQKSTPTRGRTYSENPPTPKNEQKQDPRIRRLDIQLRELVNEGADLKEQIKQIPEIPGRLVMYQFPLHIPQKEANETPKPTRWVLGPEIDMSNFFFWSEEAAGWIPEWDTTNSLPSRLKVELAFKKPDGTETLLEDILLCEIFSPDAAKAILTEAEKEDAQAQRNLGMMYFNGNQVKKDRKEAAKWLRKSAEQGNAKAQAHLALMYLRGEGVTKDLVTGKAWLTIFDKNRLGAYEITDDVHITIDKGSRLIRKMTDAQYHKAERMAKDMIRRNPKLVNTI